MAIAAIAQAFASDLWSLIAIRFVLGIGVGADYMLSPTIMAEHANQAERGKTLGDRFRRHALARRRRRRVSASAVGCATRGRGARMAHRAGRGAIPALAVIYLRRRMPETTRYLLRLAGDSSAAADVVAAVSGSAGGVFSVLTCRGGPNDEPALPRSFAACRYRNCKPALRKKLTNRSPAAVTGPSL